MRLSFFEEKAVVELILSEAKDLNCCSFKLWYPAEYAGLIRNYHFFTLRLKSDLLIEFPGSSMRLIRRRRI